MTLEITIDRYECGFDLYVDRHDGKHKGCYNIRSEDDTFCGYLECSYPKQGIPRLLINAASEEMAKIANRLGRSLSHLVFLSDERSQHLSHIFEGAGYTNRGMMGFDLVLEKEYKPDYFLVGSTVQKVSDLSERFIIR